MIYNDNSCSGCGGVRVKGSTLCVDCLVACNVRVLNENTSLETQIEIDGYNAATIILEKNAEIEDLKCRLKLRTNLYRGISEEYQELLAAVKEDVCKKRGG